MKKIYTLFAFFLFSGPAFSDVPDVVIEQCMSANEASDIPKCLKEGALGHQLLKAATSEDYYGEGAEPVAEICIASNKSYQGAWTCFKVAAKAAMETRNLVGIDKISDACVAAISDEDIYLRLSDEAKRQRRATFPDEFFSGGNLYHKFNGC